MMVKISDNNVKMSIYIMFILLITLYVLNNIKGLDNKDLILTVCNTKIHDINDYGNKDFFC